MPKNRWVNAMAQGVVCFFAFAFAVSAAASAQSESPFLVDVPRTAQRLPQNSVFSIIQARDGYLWFGTLKGLVRFDGFQYTVFDEGNTPGLNDNHIIFLFEDSRTNLWVGTETAGIALIKDGRIKNYNPARGGSEGRLLYAYEDSAGVVWFSTADGRFSRYVNGSMEDMNPSMFSSELLYRTARMRVPSEAGGFWLIQGGRVQKWKDNRMQRDLGAFPWTTNTIVTSACEDREGNLIVGTAGEGVFWYGADGRPAQISKEQGLSHNTVLSVCMDRDGVLWVGTNGGGLNRVKRKMFIAPQQWNGSVAQSISEDAKGGLWICFNGGGAVYWKDGVEQKFGAEQGLTPNVSAVLMDRHQSVWIGARGEETRDQGLFHLVANHFERAAGSWPLVRNVSAIHEDRTGQLWIGTQDGLARWNGSEWKLFTMRDGLSTNFICTIADDSGGNLWIGTQRGGLNLFRDGRFSEMPPADGVHGETISSLLVDKEGVLWVGTDARGLLRLQNGEWKRYTKREGLASDSIGYLIEDEQGYLWIGSNAGLMRASKKSLGESASGSTNSTLFRVYEEADGLPTHECSFGSQPAACRTVDGRLWFPTIKGPVSLNPAELKPNPFPPPVVIERVLIEGREQRTNGLRASWEQAVTLRPGRENLEIHFTSLNLGAADKARFKYRMEGHEAGWTDAENSRVAHYPKLPPGEYHFRVKACNEDGVWNQTGSVLAVTVLPPFWQTWWFIGIVTAGIIGIIASVVRYLSTQKLQRQLAILRQQEALEKERARIARDLHDQLGANLTQVSLLSEMAEADKNSPREVEEHTQQISQTARETTRSLDEIVWAVNPSNDTLEGLINYASKYAQEYLAMAGVRYRLDVPTQLPSVTIPPEVRHNVFLAFKEAVNNVVKHAQATEARIRLRLERDTFTLEIEDNGRGMAGLDEAKVQARNGLRNMRKRMEDIRGEFSIGSGNEGGTRICLTAPVLQA